MKAQFNKLFTLLTILTLGITNVWANQTDLVTDVTLPDVPASCLDMASQSAYTPDANGWIVFNPYSVTSTWWKVTSQSSQSATCDQSRLDALEPIAPFVPLTSGSAQKINYNGNYAAAVRFKGATNISFLVHPRSSKTFYVGLYSYNPSTSAQVLIEEKSVSGNNANVIEYTGLTTSTEYIAYMYGKVSQNMSILELAIKAPVNTDGPFAITYDKNNEGASGTMTDANSPYAKDATVTVLGNSFTAPTGMVFAGWNTKADGSGTSYAAGNTFDAVKDVTLYAQWAYPATGTGTITYTLTKGKADVSAEVSGVSKLSSSSTAFSVSTLAIGSNNAKDGYSGQITGHAEAYSASQYVALQFTVTDGYTFTPSAVSMKVFANSTSNMKMKLVLTDGTTSVESEELACSSSADSDIEFASGAFTGKKFVGNVDVVLYQWGVTSKRTYVKSPVTITGTVAAAAPKYDVIFANGGEGTGDMATLKYEAGEEVTLPACGYTPVSGREFDGWTSSDVTISAGKFEMPAKNVTITATWRDEAVKYTITYDVNGGSSATPTETDKAAGDEFALAAAPEYDGYHFEGWLCDADAVMYDAEAAYTMTGANTEFTAQWKPYSTISIANKTYIIGIGDFNAVSDLSSNSDGAMSYALKEAYTGVTLSSAGVFSATVAGDYIVVANQVANATYAATSKEFTITVLDNELSDTYVWKKGTGYTGCVANPNADAPAAQYTDIAYEGFTGMGRAAADNTECILTFTVKAAYSANFGIKSICTYGKLEEPAGGQISWDGGTNWEDLASYGEGKKEFNAPAATFPTSFKIRFLGVSASSGGLYWRNALVTLEVKKTVSGITEALQNVKVNDAAISASDLTSLQTNKTLNIATTYAAAPTVTFVKRTTTNYLGGWPASVVDTEEDVVASDATTNWSATSSAINAQTYTVTLAKPAGPTLETTATSFTLTSAKIATAQEQFTFSGANLSGNVTISLESAVTGMTVSPTEVTPTAGAITDQEVTITYKSLDDVATANVNLIVYYDADTKITIPLTYSSTAGVEDLTPISAATTWNWDGAADAAFGTLGQNDMIVLVNADVTWNASFNASAIAGKLQHYYRESKYAQGNELKFNTTIPGKVYVTYSNTGGNPARTVNVNGTKGSLTTAGTGEKRTESFLVSAGDVLIKGVLVSDDSNQMLRFYEVRFAPVYSVTYDAGEGSVKGGEVIPTQADEAAGEKITLASADALEKSGYDFTGWLCNVDGVTYNAGVEYTMTAAATTFTAQWAVHVDPVDPTLTYDNGAYTIGSTALDLSTLQTASTSTGAITYSVKDAGTTGATIDGVNFTATAAGTAIITASQAAVLGYNAKEVDFNVVVTEATEIDGIKLVEAGALTGNFITASTLTEGANIIEGINYAKYIKFSSTFGGSYQGGAKNNYLMYDLKKQNTTFYLYVHNNSGSTAYKIVVYTYNTASTKATEIEVAAGENALKSFELNDVTENTRVFIGVNNTNVYLCQVVAVESGADLMKGGEIGYEINFGAKSRFSAAGGTAITMDGMEFVTSSQYVPNNGTEVAISTLGTNYVKFTLPVAAQIEVTTNSTNKYFIGSTYASDEATSKTYEHQPAANGEMHSFALAAGTWYLNPNGSNIKLTKLAFSAPKCAEPEFNALANSDLCAGDPYVALDGTATVADAGVPTYQWYNADGDVELVGETNATYTPSADGSYYVIATNHLADHSDNAKQSATVTVTHFASAVITTAPANVRKTAGEAATLTVEATGKNLSYEWFTCDDAMGTNPVAIVPAETNATLNVMVPDGIQYYMVVVSSDCGADLSAVAKVEKFVALPQLHIDATTTWDLTTCADAQIQLTNTTSPKKGEECLMANIEGVHLDANFNSQALVMSGEYIYRNVTGKPTCAEYMKFITDVEGVVTVTFAGNGDNRLIRVTGANGVQYSTVSAGTSDVHTEKFYVTPGEVELMGMNDAKTETKKYMRFFNITFTAEPNYTRNVTEGRYGTICLPNGGVMVGAELYEVAYYGATSQKIFLDEIPSGEMVAGRPYIFLPNEGASQLGVFYTDAVNADAGSHNGLIGSYTKEPIAANAGNYILLNNQYCPVESTVDPVYVGANKAYIKLGDITPVAPSLKPGAKRVGLGVAAPQTPTGVDNLNASETPIKVMINGQMYIIRGEKMYNATGRLVK